MQYILFVIKVINLINLKKIKNNVIKLYQANIKTENVHCFIFEYKGPSISS